MTIYYSYLLSLLFLLLITRWTNTASLRSFLRSSSKWSLDRRHPSFIVKNEVTTTEPVLSRRRPQLISNERQRRWSKDEDNDEVEIPIDEINIEQSTSTLTIDNESTVLSDDISSFNSTTVEVRHPLLRQDFAVINPTDKLPTISIDEEVSENNNTNIENIFPSTTSNEIIDNNSTESEILPTNVTQEISNEKNKSIIDNLTTIETSSNEIEISTISPTEFSTMTQFNQDTAIILFDHTTISSATNNETSIDSETEINTTVIDDVINTSIILDTTSTTDNTIIISDAIHDDTSTVIFDDNEYSNETISFTSTTTAKPICDQSCQCFKKCPYGFEIINDTCQCDPPCKNYPCFGNDTCTLTKKGQPLCRPENGSEHDHPIRCYQPRDAGYHDDDMRYYNRWYYNPDQDTCHLFVYRGLGGNENNFQTLHECHLECITCASLPDPGICLGFIRMWYYDYKKNQCSQFEYSGCKGNENKFLRKQECVDTCITRILNL